jgi:S-adenosylmethionine:tRNA ribosyltransferase-isomerase
VPKSDELERFCTLKRTDFDFSLPPELIASTPLNTRSDSRLLVADGSSHSVRDAKLNQLASEFRAGDLLVFNNSKVLKARLFAHKASGGAVEILVERVIHPNRVLALLRVSKKPKTGGTLLIKNAIVSEDVCSVKVLGRQDDLFELHCDEPWFDLMEKHGHVPLPPYIERDDTVQDIDRYQTVFAKEPGSVAAPTAGLHFDEPLLEQLRQRGVAFAYVTLHVGAGTFQPVRADNLHEHKMHAEWAQVDQTVVAQIAKCKAAGGRVIAVGTTATRALESAAQSGMLGPFTGDTRIFIKPGDSFNVIDGLLTNFHLPQSTLLMLVSAFAGLEFVLQAYEHAIAQRYRFYSYGDATLFWPKR